MANKYIDIPSIVQVIGGIYNNPELLDNEDKYFFTEEDFTEEFHRVLFGSIYNLHKLGVKEITPNTIEDYLESRPKLLGVFNANKGAEYLQKLKESTQLAAFNYYYNKMKKMTLLRMYDNVGFDVSWIYDVDNILDVKKKQAQEDWLDNHSLVEISDLIDKKIAKVRTTYVDNTDDEVVDMSEGILDLINDLKENPDLGIPLYGKYINTVTRGARLGKFYLRSAATGVGKSRAMIADACTIGCDEIWSKEEKKWISTGASQTVLYIATEQDLQECQTMVLAFLSGVNEDHILYGDYTEGEWERVVHAAEVVHQGKIKFEAMPDFSLGDIETKIKIGIREYNCYYVFNSQRV